MMICMLLFLFQYNTIDTVSNESDTVSTVENRDETEEAHANSKPGQSTVTRVETPDNFNLSKSQKSIEMSTKVLFS